MTAPLPAPSVLAARLAGTPLLVMLDVDGTLAPIAPRPEEAVVPEEARRVVAVLASRPGVRVVLVSGRAAEDARRMVAVATVWVIGNHGIEVVSPDGETMVEPELEQARPVVAQAARRLGPLVAHVPGVILEDKKWTLSVHYRLADPAVVDKLRSAVEETARQLGLRATDGKKVIELRPAVRVDKGTAVLNLAQRMGALGGGASLLYVGDDRTDEDAFRALRARSPGSVTVRVTHGDELPTAAEFTVREPADVLALLEWLAAARR